jgi:hypothetical protein
VEHTLRTYVQPGAVVEEIATMPLADDERGYSGASLHRHVVTFRSSQGGRETRTLITKDASLVERRVLAHLTAQGHCVPFSASLDLITDGPALVCQQDLGPPSSQRSDPGAAARQVARCMARIHHANLRRANDLDWLPRADRAYFEDRILADYRRQLALAMEQPAFATRHGEIVRQMEAAVHPFLAAMDDLWAAQDTLTLIHADLSSDHVRMYQGHPYFIDWGQARFGSFYLDLPNFFLPDDVLHYRDALADLGLEIPVDTFMRRYAAAGRYPGFKYMGFLLFLCRQGKLASLQGPLLHQLLHGKVRAT